MKVPEQKSALRQDLLHSREQLTPAQIDDASRHITARCIQLIPWDKTSSVHTYLPIPNRNEVSTWPLLDYIWHHRPEVETAIPVMQEGHLRSAAIGSQTQLRKNQFGFSEPEKPLVYDAAHTFDVIIVPTLGFDRHGSRLGYGQGHYDQFLASQPPAITVGLAYSALEVSDGLPTEPHDVPLDYIVTENEVISRSST